MDLLGIVGSLTAIAFIWLGFRSSEQPQSSLMGSLFGLWLLGVSLWLTVPAHCFRLGYIEVNDVALTTLRWPVCRMLIWNELKYVRRIAGNKGELFLVGVRKDGSTTKHLSIMMESPTEADWWAEVVKQMDAHGIRHYSREDGTWDVEAEERELGGPFLSQNPTLGYWLRGEVKRWDPRP